MKARVALNRPTPAQHPVDLQENANWPSKVSEACKDRAPMSITSLAGAVVDTGDPTRRGLQSRRIEHVATDAFCLCIGLEECEFRHALIWCFFLSYC